jgi:hypothetical protein
MSSYHSYFVKFVYGDKLEEQIRKFQAANPGHAFRRCVQQYPGSKLIEAWREGGRESNYASTTYAPPSTVKIKSEPAPKSEQSKFSFFDCCLSRRPLSG